MNLFVRLASSLDGQWGQLIYIFKTFDFIFRVVHPLDLALIIAQKGI